MDDCNTHSEKSGWLALALVRGRFAAFQRDSVSRWFQCLWTFGGVECLFGTKSGYSEAKPTIQTSHSTVSQYSLLSYGNEILWSLSYFSQRYNCMLAPSKTRFGLPEVWSTRAGMRPLAGGYHQSVMYILQSCDGEGNGG